MKHAIRILIIFALLTHLQAQQSGSRQDEITILKAEVTAQKNELAEVKALLQQLLAKQSGTSATSATSQTPSPSATTATTGSVATPNVAKQLAEVSETLSRFRFTGDVRVRYENFTQGCALCNTRHRERIRARFGVEGKVGEDFLGGLAVSTGSALDPISTNDTLTNFFERKTISLDRAYITYAPKNHKWLSVTGGKFAYTWNRSPLAFDPDLNPEGLTEKLSFDVKSSTLKKVNITAMQLFFNEVSGPNGAQGLATGADSFAAGAQMSGTFQFGKRLTVTPSYSLINWRNADAIAQAYVRAGQTANASSVLNPSATTSALGSSNANTNDTIVTGSGASTLARFRSKFLYSDLMVVSEIKTKSAKYPVTLTLEYLDNLRAARSLVTGTPQDKALWAEVNVGRAKEHGDLLFGYAWGRVEQDSVIAAFAESDKRAGTNVLQNKFLFGYQISPRVNFSYTGWLGRTLNPKLPSSQLAPGRTALQSDPWLFRSQVDLVYKF